VNLDAAIDRVAASEANLAAALESVGKSHRDEHDVFHTTGTLAKMSRARVEKVRPKGAVAAGDEPGTGELLDALRTLHLLAAEASIDWTILGQGARAAKDGDLLTVVDECHADELRTLKWTTTRIKEAAPQALTS
jgi:hypothetical protein